MKSNPYVDFGRHDTFAALSAGKMDGVCIRGPGPSGEVSFVSTPRAIHTATDSAGSYNGGRYHWGSLTSPVHETATRFDTLVPSWNAKTPAGTWMKLEIRVRSGGAWTDWLDMGVWASGVESVERHSVDGQETGRWRVATDTLYGAGLVFADAYQYRLTLFTEEWDVSPKVRGVFLTASDSTRHGEDLGAPPDAGSWGWELGVPARSQMVYPDGGEVWCSPASLSMVMAYWAGETGEGRLDQPVPAVARGTYDATYEGNGNWPFNTAYAASFGLEATVNRMGSLGQAERWVAAGVPMVASIKWNNEKSGQQLTGAPLTSSDGHLLVVQGFDLLGNVIVNDPAGSDDASVRRVYRRDEFACAWLHGSGGVVYLVYPAGRGTPGRAYAQGSW